MKIKSALLTQMSGSIGGMTGAHNAGGLYLRSRANPVNPNTSNQQQVKSALTAGVNAWTEELTPAQRESWDLYALNVLVTDTLGDARAISGQNWYIAANTPRLQAQAKVPSVPPLLRVDNAPSMFNRGTYSTPSLSAPWEQNGDLLIAFNNTDEWASEIGAAMLVYQGKPRNASRTFFRGPFRLIGTTQGAAVPPPSPINIDVAQYSANGWPVEEGQAVTIAVAVTRADGRLSTRREFTTIIAAEV